MNYITQLRHSLYEKEDELTEIFDEAREDDGYNFLKAKKFHHLKDQKECLHEVDMMERTLDNLTLRIKELEVVEQEALNEYQKAIITREREVCELTGMYETKSWDAGEVQNNLNQSPETGTPKPLHAQRSESSAYPLETDHVKPRPTRRYDAHPGNPEISIPSLDLQGCFEEGVDNSDVPMSSTDKGSIVSEAMKSVERYLKRRFMSRYQ